MRFKPAYFVGLDLGQSADPSALAVVEQSPGYDLPKPRHSYAVRHLHRWELGTPYPQIVREVASLLARDPLPGCVLCLDNTGVGRPVTDLFREARFPAKLVPVTFTAGNQVTRDGGAFRVPKKDLVGVMVTLLQSGRLSVAEGLPLARVLAQELRTFRVKVNPATGHESLEAWREKDHDDLVFATAMPCWFPERPRVVAGAYAPR